MNGDTHFWPPTLNFVANELVDVTRKRWITRASKLLVYPAAILQMRSPGSTPTLFMSPNRIKLNTARLLFWQHLLPQQTSLDTSG